MVDQGDFDELRRVKWQCNAGGYAYRTMSNGKNSKGRWTNKGVFMHALICPSGEGMDIDHINHEKLDNRRTNLRAAPHRNNMRNMNIHRDQRSGFKGICSVSRYEGRLWQARIRVNGKVIQLGSRPSKEAAARLYDEGALKYFGEFACTNASLGLLFPLTGSE